MREAYERGPDGKRWPGSLRGLNEALDDSLLDSLMQPETEFTLFVIDDGSAVPIRVFKKGKVLAYGDQCDADDDPGN